MASLLTHRGVGAGADRKELSIGVVCGRLAGRDSILPGGVSAILLGVSVHVCVELAAHWGITSPPDGANATLGACMA